MGLNAGLLREKIKITREERTQNASGGFENTETTILETYASVKEMNVSADILASQENVNNLTQFRIRYRPIKFLNNGDIIHWRGFKYRLNRFTVDPLRTEIKIVANSEIETTKR